MNRHPAWWLLLGCVLLTPAATRADTTEIYAQTLRATAWVITPTRAKGTAWILDRAGKRALTAYHIVGEQDRVELFFPVREKGELITDRAWYFDHRRELHQTGKAVHARVLKRDRDRDLALLALNAVPEGTGELPLAADVRPGEPVLSVGCRGDLDVLWGCTQGTIRQVFRTREGYWWQGQHLGKGAMLAVAQLPINEGDSGSPIVNERGELVGVVSAIRWQARGAAVCIHVDEVRAFLGRPQPPPPKQGHAVYDRLLKSVALVKTSTSSGRATGWLLDPSRRLLFTAYHVVGDLDAVDVVFPAWKDGRLRTEASSYKENRQKLRQDGLAMRGAVLARDARRNLALIELESVPGRVAGLELAEGPARPGQAIHAIGNPSSLEALWVHTAGSVRQLGRANLGHSSDGPNPRVVLIQAPTSDGDAGAPVVDDRGRLVGVMSGKSAPQQMVSYATAAAEVNEFLTAARPLCQPRTPADHAARADRFLKATLYDPAIAAWTAALKLDPKHAASLAGRGQAYLLKGDTDRALADCAAALRIDPKLVPAYCHRAAAFCRKGEPNKALADCTEAIRLAPKCAPAYSIRGNAHRLRRDLAHALADCDEAAALDVQLPSAFLHRGLVYLAKGDHDRAVADLGRAIQLDPADATARLRRGEAHRRRHDPRAAVADIAEAVRLNPALLDEVLNEIVRGGQGGADDPARQADWYQMALTALRPALEEVPEAQQHVADGLARVAKEMDPARRAKELRHLLAGLRQSKRLPPQPQ